MLKNYFKTAFRSFLRNKSFSLINITGLAIGISASLVIFLIVKYDFSFEKFEPDGNRIFRIGGEYTFDGGVSRNSGSPIPMGNAIAKEVSGVEVVSFFQTRIGQRISIPEPGKEKAVVHKKDNRVVYADKNYFKIIPYKWISGSPETALEQPYQVVLTESKAKLLFGDLPLSEIPGKEILLSDTIRATVTGIVKDIVVPTDFTFNVFVSRATFEITSLTPDDWSAWDNVSSETQVFLKISPAVTSATIQAQVNALYQKHRKPDPEDNISSTKFILQPLSDIHFNADYDNFDQAQAHMPTLYGLLAIAALLLLLGCINFINLTTAQASQRAREIGIRKTIGSSSKQLVLQFLSETFLLTLIATLLSVLIAPLLLKAFGDFIPAGLHFEILQPQVLIFLVALTLFISLLSGFYPALILSSYKPVTVLKNQSSKGAGAGRNVRLRKVLSVSQFVIAQVFIIATILVSKQIRYSLNKDLGFKKDAIVFFEPNPSRVSSIKTGVLVQKIKAIPGLQMVSVSYGPPSYRGGWTTSASLKGAKNENVMMASVKLGDPDYIRLYDIKLLAGSNLSISDTINGLLINETFLHDLGFKNPSEVIGKILDWNQMKTPVVGVVADFHEKSMHETIKPLIITHWAGHEGVINIALPPQDPENHTWQKAMDKIGLAWKEVYPDDDIEIEFLDQQIAKYYEADQHISSLLLWASGLSIFISCLGLLGLIIYITNQRTKEIGIRKVIGASITQIIALLSKDFLQLVVIAFLIAVPIAWYSSHKWLENFAYRTELSWWIFLAGGTVMLLMALLILVLRTLKVAAANPVNSLRSE